MKKRLLITVETGDHMHAGCSGCRLWPISAESCILNWDDNGSPGPECFAAEIEVDGQAIEDIRVMGIIYKNGSAFIMGDNHRLNWFGATAMKLAEAYLKIARVAEE